MYRRMRIYIRWRLLIARAPRTSGTILGKSSLVGFGFDFTGSLASGPLVRLLIHSVLISRNQRNGIRVQREDRLG